MRPMTRRPAATATVWSALALAAAAACSSPAPYVCAVDADCTLDGVPGRCVPGDDGRSYCAEDTGPLRLSGDECLAGARLDPAASTCIADVCATQPWCCEASWGPTCVLRAEVACGAACGGRVAFGRERLTNPDHTQFLEEGGVEVWDFAAAGGAGDLAATAVPTGIRGLFAYWRVVWMDADRYGGPELLATTFDGYVGGDHQWVYRPAASGAWTEVVDLMAVGAPTNNIDAAVGDYDGDGRIDLAFAGGSGLAVMRGVDTGALFTPGRTFPNLPETDPLTATIDAGDLDGDGDDDFVYLDYRHDLGRGVRSDAAGFGLLPPFVLQSVVADARLGDVDGDRDLDLLISDSAGAMVLENDGAGVLSPVWNYPTGQRNPGGAWSRAAWIDVEGDGDLDVLLGAYEAPYLTLLENVGGVVADQPLWSTSAGGEVEGLSVGDVDADGDLDIATAGGDAPSAIWVNLGDRTFEPRWIDAGPRRHRRVAMTRRP